MNFMKARGRRAKEGHPFAAAAVKELLEAAASVDDRVEVLVLAIAELLRHQSGETNIRRSHTGRRKHDSHIPLAPPDDAWIDLDGVDVSEHFMARVPTMQNCPKFMRGRWRQAMTWTLQKRQEHKQQNNHLGALRAWKLFAMLPMMLLRATRQRGAEGRRILEQRFDDFQKGN